VPLSALSGIRVRRALLSVSDKTGVVAFARGLVEAGVDLLATGRTHAALREAGIPAREIAAYTGFPEMLGGRVKTLHPRVHGGILFRRDDPAQAREAEANGIEPIDLVAVNLYPFEEASERAGISLEELVEEIDIGGPALLRAAAKNHRHVVVVTSPARYGDVLQAIRSGERVPADLALSLAREALARTAAYDAAITRALAARAGEALPATFASVWPRRAALRYGENPHQRAALYAPARGEGTGVLAYRQISGKDLSYNNYLDLDAALRVLLEFAEPACVVVKHTNPCGAAWNAAPASSVVGAASPGSAPGEGPRAGSPSAGVPLLLWSRALRADPVSAFGGIVAFNVEVDAEAAASLAGTFLEVIAAPGFDPAAREALAAKKNLRLLEGTPRRDPDPLAARTIQGALLIQERDAPGIEGLDLKTVTRRAPSEGERAALLRAWRVVKHVKSNAIVLADPSGTIGIGVGETNRVDAVRQALSKARRSGFALEKAVLASDAFFPFRDSVDEAAKAGITAVLQPGGSIRDADAIAAADEAGIAMLFTGRRGFLH
jgi:phosphoribosylaminoimidazolecarboxamide formyltransferase/IMP cyclohydrolase